MNMQECESISSLLLCYFVLINDQTLKCILNAFLLERRAETDPAVLPPRQTLDSNTALAQYMGLTRAAPVNITLALLS